MAATPLIGSMCAPTRTQTQSHGTLKSEGKAARQNGFLHVVMPPDTIPVLENGALLQGLREGRTKTAVYTYIY